MKPKIAIFHNLPTGGAKRVLHENIKGLNRVYDFDLFDIQGPYDNFLNIRPLVKETFTFKFVETPQLPKPLGFLNNFCRIYDIFRLNNLHKEIASKIDKNDYKLVFIFADRFSQTPFLIKHLKTKSLYYAHDPYKRNLYESEIERPELNQSLKEKIKKIFYFPGKWLFNKILAVQDENNTKKASKVIICSNYAGSLMKQKYGINPITVYPGINTETFHHLTERKDFAVISQGSVLYRKGHHFLIDSLSNIKEENRPSLYILADTSKDDEEKFLLNEAEKKKVNVRIFKKILDQNEVVRIYNKALICLCGQIKEPFNLSVLEASACELLVVSVNEGGMKETIIDNKTGFLVERNPIIFANKIEELLKDDDKRKTMGKNGRQYMNTNFVWSITNQKLRDIIDELIV